MWWADQNPCKLPLGCEHAPSILNCSLLFEKHFGMQEYPERTFLRTKHTPLRGIAAQDKLILLPVCLNSGVCKS